MDLTSADVVVSGTAENELVRCDVWGWAASNNGMQRTALRAAADAGRWAAKGFYI